MPPSLARLNFWNQIKSPCFSTIDYVPINNNFLEWWRTTRTHVSCESKLGQDLEVLFE
jgi:hypothetical protein